MDVTSEIGSATNGNTVKELLLVAKMTRAYVEIALRDADLRHGQDEFLNVLTVEPMLSTSDIASKLDISTSTVSKMTDVLSGKGLVERVPNDADHRKTLVVLTPLGLEMQTLVRKIWRGVEENLSGELTPAETAELREGLELLGGILRERLARRR
ncbi:MAG: transcriptional regulator [Aurantimonas sp.]|nr:transcriptional regulator [Aurantimonas sp.]|tara:strand:- start:925 stop:1389 length:465 start_codon:yes stop_codon:yes gene_type:complete